MRYSYILIIVLLVSCKQNKDAKILLLENAIDSFYLTGISDSKELSNSAWNDSSIICYNYYTGTINHYKRNGSNFGKKTTQYIDNSFYLDAFCYDNDKNCSILIGKDSNKGVNNIFSIHKDGKKIRVDSVKLNLKNLQEGEYRFSTINSQPILIRNSNIIIVAAYNAPTDYQSWLSEKVFCNLNVQNNKVSSIEYIFDKPSDLRLDVQTAPVYCLHKNVVILAYPCIDSLYTYNLDQKKYKTYYIGNPFFSRSEPYDFKRWQEADYFTMMNLKSFSYEGVFFNTNTNHLILYFSTAVDKSIEVPTYDDKKHYAIVLDEHFKVIKTVLFKERFSSPGRFLNTPKGIYMPLALKNHKDEKTIRYYMYDL